MDQSKKSLLELLKKENDFMTYLLEAFEIPETIENDSDEEYLTESKVKKQKLNVGENKPAETAEELEERHNMVKQKLTARKNQRTSQNPAAKAERKKKRKESSLKKAKTNALKNESLKQDRGIKTEVKKENPDKPAQPIFNEEQKLMFSKVNIDGQKQKRKGLDPNPRKQLENIISQKKKLRQLIDSGDKEKATKLKKDNLWKAAFEKTDGVKVKDNVEILQKTIKKRKLAKIKSKDTWSKNKDKVEEKKTVKIKKREDNLAKKSGEKKKNKHKLKVKLGRVF